MKQWFALGFACFLSACQPTGTQFLNTNIQGRGLKTQIALNQVDGTSLQLNAAKPHTVTAVFFGYTQCPDACPTTMGELKLVKKQLGQDADKLHVVFVSLDPERDTPQILKQYSAAFDPTFISVSTTPEQTKVLAKDLNINYEKVGQGAFYTLNHSSNTYLIDPSGHFRVSVPYGTQADSIAHDVQQLLAEGS